MSFIPVVAGAWIAVFALNVGWDEPDTTLANAGAWLTAGLGVVGLVAAIRWRARVTERPLPADALLTPFFITLAFAEVPMLVGFVFTILAQDVTPFVVGTVVFVIALVIMLTALNQIEIRADGGASELIR